MDKATLRAVLKMLQQERQEITATYGKSRAPYQQGLRDMRGHIEQRIREMLKDLAE